MKNTFKKVTASIAVMLTLFSSTYTTAFSVSAANQELQTAKSWYVYGDVNNNGYINLADAVLVAQFITDYKNKVSNSIIPVEIAEEYTESCIENNWNDRYYLPVPKAADVDGDGYITEADMICIQNYNLQNYDKIGRCGQPFFIN